MSRHIRLSGRFILISLVLAGLSACARGPEFEGTPQAGASNTGTWPTFAKTPQGATTQFSTQDVQNLKSQLESEQSQQRTMPAPPPVSQAQVDAQRKQAQEEAARTLKEIETESN
ncbi:hypothetical protein [Brucella sp. IR073]|uniref:hypothetical protein n=1 Tax=unclassified Brucella TaxID=2632610 RepID=UPI003B9810E2